MKLLLGYPIFPYYRTQLFGDNTVAYYKELGLTGHNGIDLRANDGQPVMAAHDGIITFSGDDGSGGYGIVIRTLEKFDYKDAQCHFKSIYWHLKPGTFKVKAGDKVSRGTVLAGADNTGKSTGTHLHFGLKPVYQGEQDWQWFNLEQANGFNGAIDPAPYIDPDQKPPVPVQFLENLSYGDKNNDVKRLQDLLKREGFMLSSIPSTGYYGTETSKAVLMFQLKHEVSSPVELLFLKGKSVGPKTRKVLNNL